ncbi:4-hydroxy-3-methylbut-2-enyl diphosphate reductase [Hydrogenophaga sp.]|uniref:4-hydroxy-3-methylbut-2-enyl diphosphate reductase n=1 Tax=Hydrogenophaga sp. TaxID=1904254 RepID=UPI002715A35C|nr:4-hydroxy-3-methylbut-2-enyl diphosphate reductase [Hydrogenophaga sp.]MDO8906727.1 4-hydroxy-3-methylbut-2-enyl diphosphate reductase [Hydrogenophaga sp.]
MQILLAQPRGFCAGVTRAIDIVDRALARHGAPVYVFHEIVHNQWVVNDLRSRGAVFVDSLRLVPPGAHVVFSAHGVSADVETQARAFFLHTVDATCPLVSKVHQQAQRFERLGYTLLMIGHAGHQEVRGTMGRVRGSMHLISQESDVAALNLPSDVRIAYVTQTTLSLEDTRDVIAALKQRFPFIVGPDVNDICYATQNRQVAVRALAAQVDIVLVVGARNSSNSNRLREVAARAGVPAHLVQEASEIQPDWLGKNDRVGVTSGASTPELLVQQVVQALQASHAGPVVQLPGVRENVMFRMPAEVADETA